MDSGQTFLTNNGPLLDPAHPNSLISEFDPVVSPDAQKIAFESNRTGGQELYTMNADGTGPATRLTSAPGEDRPGSYSPDGTKIVFHSTRDSNDFEVYTMNSDGSNQTRLTLRPGRTATPAGRRTEPGSPFTALERPGSQATTIQPGRPPTSRSTR